MMSEDLKLLSHQPRALIAAIAIGLIGAGVLIGVTWALEVVDNPPTRVLDSYLINSTVERGGVLKLYVKLNSLSNRQCPGSVTREFSTTITLKNGNSVPDKWRDDAPAPIVTEEEDEYVINMPLVIKGVEIPAGTYIFQGETSYYCSWFRKQRFRTTIKDLQIVAKGTLPKE